MSEDLVVREEVALVAPEEVVKNATAQSKILMQIVNQTKCYQEIAGKKYLQVEAWETIGAFNRTHAETESIEPIMKGEDIIGYQAHVQLWKDGVVAGGAVMPCYFTENCCKGKEGDAKHKSAMSAAQTFATSKAYRMNFSYVAILAGFQPLPAEEVTEDMRGEMDTTQHYCSIHKTNFFMKGKMKSFAHPIKDKDGNDTGDWCHEHKEKPEPAEGVKGAPERIQVDAEEPLPDDLPEPEPTEQEPVQPELKPEEKKDERLAPEKLITEVKQLFLKELNKSQDDLGKIINGEKKWQIKSLKSLKTWQANELIAIARKELGEASK